MHKILQVQKATASNGNVFTKLTLLSEDMESTLVHLWEDADLEVNDILHFNLAPGKGNYPPTVLNYSIPSAEENIPTFEYTVGAEQQQLLQDYKEAIGEYAGRFSPVVVTVLDKLGETNVAISPAAKGMHHAFQGGLLAHTLSMLTSAINLARHYGADTELVSAGVMLHDLAKVLEMDPNGVYSKEGGLLGHIPLIYGELVQLGHLLNEDDMLQLQHIVLSHHGKMEYGSPVVPKTREAIIVSTVDDLDARMGAIDIALETISVGEFSEPVRAYGNTRIYKNK